LEKFSLLTKPEKRLLVSHAGDLNGAASLIMQAQIQKFLPSQARLDGANGLVSWRFDLLPRRDGRQCDIAEE
jgi:hypothetical protein